MTGVLSAKQVCTMAHWAAKGGMVGQVKDLALNPESSSGNFAKHLDRHLGLAETKKKVYKIPLVGAPKPNGLRTTFNLDVIPPHELLNRSLQDDPTIATRLQEAIDHPDYLPPAYFQNPIVRSAREAGVNVLPLSLYLDGVPYSINDSVTGIWIGNLITDERFLTGIVKKNHE